MNLRITILCAVTLGLVVPGLAAEAVDPVTLEEALGRAFARHPAVVAADAAIDAKAGAATQAGLLPNPELEFEVEELGAPGGSDAWETTMALRHSLELGNKRPRRREVARLEQTLAQSDADTVRLEVEAEVRSAFTEALAAQERAKLQEELVGIAAETLSTVSERVKAGKVSPIEETQALLEMTANRIALRKSQTAWGAARTALAGTWGGTGADVPAVHGRLDELTVVPPLDQLTDGLSDTPDWSRWKTEIALGEATRALEHAGGVPDLGLTGGIRTLGGGDETTFLVAVALPLPLFDRNQGAVAEATANLARKRAEQRAAERTLRRELETAHLELLAAREEAEAVRDALLPSARQAYEAIREGYQWGKFEYLALLEAQRTLLEARIHLVDASAAFHLAAVRLDRLTARPSGRSATP